MATYKQPLTRNNSGTIEYAEATRDFSAYPNTNAGNDAFTQAINNGSIAVTASTPASSIVGEYVAPLVDARRDFKGTPLEVSSAVKLIDSARTKPRLLGNWYPFTPQTALNAPIHSRIPQFQNHPKKFISYPGGLYTTAADNNMIGRGWTHVTEACGTNTSDGVYPTQFRRSLQGAYYGVAYTAAMTLPAGDPRRTELLAWAGPLPAFEGEHVLIKSYETMKYYAKFWYLTLMQPDWKGAGVDFFSVNHEVHTGSYQDYYRHVGMLTQAIIEEAAANGQTWKSAMYDFGDMATVGAYFFDRPATGTLDNGTPIVNPDASIPRYMHPMFMSEPYGTLSPTNPLNDGTTVGNLLRSGYLYIGLSSYQQHTWDDQTLFQKKDGNYLTDENGDPYFRTDARTTTVTGQSVKLYSGEPMQAMLKLYGYFSRYSANAFFRSGGKHLPVSTDRQTGWEKMLGQCRNIRIDCEVESGVTGDPVLGEELNSRAMNPDWVEGDAIGMYLWCDFIQGFMANQPASNLGSERKNSSQSRASVEMYEKGWHRASMLNWINDTPWRLVQPKFFSWQQGIGGAADPNEHFSRKPIVFGGLTKKDGKPTLWLFWWWPCMDVDMVRDMIIWGDRGSGPVTPGYRVQFNGRKCGLEYWSLPDAMENAEPKHLYFQFNDIMNRKQTWRGDYREARITNHPTPPTVI